MYPQPAHQTKDFSPLVYPLTSSRTIHLTQKSPENSVSTGTTLYLSSQLLAHYIQVASVRGHRAIELGAGTGLVSIALGILGWEVWATDLSNVIEDVLRTNVEGNRDGSVIVQELDWCSEKWHWNHVDPLQTPEFDLILCADGVYAVDLIDSLLRTLKTLSGSRSPPILLAFERRDSAVIDMFFERSRKLGFKSKKMNMRRILGREIARWGWTSEDWHSVEIWTMRYQPPTVDEASPMLSLEVPSPMAESNEECPNADTAVAAG
jgi:predicted nicotinamide N-methyase